MIKVRELQLRYGKHQALADVDIDLPKGQVTALVGPSGCGKSSFLMCLNRLIELVPGASVEGCICLDGKEVLRDVKCAPVLRRRIGMIFQRPNPFHMSLRRNLHLALREHGMGDKQERNQRMRRALEDVGLWEEVKDRLDDSATDLSGGQQQRLCFARALMLEPEVLLLDEPCSALDPIASEVVEQLVLQLRGRYTIGLVTHNLAQARRLADHLAVFWVKDGAGTVLCSGPAAAMFEDAGHPTAVAYLEGRRG
ncbi:MAG: phosphate ABC transporter ATP-binding protein [Planctomycetota bacterium]|nr:phosphate ABC transporter ATP-binding protein [Planctomycetota bacterium]MDA1113311.1 phosphate ABC transporter ATP-binding protein [Planctomycetota bacterium]